MNARDWIERLELEPHPEGGWYRETYRAAGSCRLPRGERAYSTAVYYLLEAGDASHMHRIASDELWHFYTGGSIAVHAIDETGRYTKHLLGREADAALQLAVPAGSWFGATLEEGADYGLVGCTVAPGFDFDDFELAERDALVSEFPHCREVIETLCR